MDEGSLDLFVFINLCQWLALALCKSSCRVPQLFVKWELGLLPNHRFCKSRSRIEKKVRAQVVLKRPSPWIKSRLSHLSLPPGARQESHGPFSLRPSPQPGSCYRLSAPPDWGSPSGTRQGTWEEAEVTTSSKKGSPTLSETSGCRRKRREAQFPTSWWPAKSAQINQLTTGH